MADGSVNHIGIATPSLDKSMELWSKLGFIPSADKISEDQGVKIRYLYGTGNTRIERWENVANIFTLAKKDAILNKHILLIDDVLTTGATLEACGQQILKLTGTKLSILTMACKV